jgi:hypothetical protein
MATTKKQQLQLQVHGLFNNPSTFTEVPQGALKIADNIVLDRENFVMPRRGFDFCGPSFGATGVESMFNYGNNLLAYTQDNKLWRDQSLDNSGDWVAYDGSYEVPDPTQQGSRVRSIESNKNFYFLTNKGVEKLDAANHQPRTAGAPPGLGGTGVTTGTSGFLPHQTNVAYRVVWGYKDANDNLILGAPSDRIIVSNAASSGTNNVDLTFQIPQEIDTTWFYQVYRSLPSVDLLTQPNDELQQVYEDVCTSAEILAGLVTISDTTPQSLMQGYLYTNPSQAGILQANYRPPFARDACFFKNFTFYANTRTVHRFNATLISSEPPLGITIGDTLTFTKTSGGTFTVTAGVAENATYGQFKVFNTGNPGLDIQNTATSLVKIVNTYSANLFLDAYYISSFDELPGQIMFEMSDLSELGFHLNSSRQSCWAQVIPATGTSAASSNDVGPNRIYFSRELQPEAVPLLNYLEVGSKNQQINRIIPLRDGIIILKQDGVFRLSGYSPTSFVITGLDNSVRILADNTAAVLDNQVYFLSDQGVVAASDNAVQIFSRPIERELLKLTSPSQFPNFKNLVFATTYNADRKYILHFPLTGVDTYCHQQYCYNSITNTWTRWTRPSLSGIVNISDNKLYFGGPNLGTDGFVYKERKTYTDQDFADEHYTVSIVSHIGSYITVSDGSKLKVGMLMQQLSSASSGTILTINGNDIQLDGGTWAVGDATAYTPIECQIQTVQIDAENPGIMKHFPEMSFIFSESNFAEMEVFFSSDIVSNESVQILRPVKKGGWGTFNWGNVAWNGTVLGQQTRIRTLVPAPHQRCNWLNIRLRTSQCFTSFGFSGISIAMNDTSSRQKNA